MSALPYGDTSIHMHKSAYIYRQTTIYKNLDLFHNQRISHTFLSFQMGRTKIISDLWYNDKFGWKGHEEEMKGQ